MDTILTIHAAKRIRERGIPLFEVTQCLIDPCKVEKDGEKTILYRLNSSATELLILVCLIDENSCKIITVIKTSKVHKYL